MVVGLHDPTGKITRQIRNYVAEDLVLVPSTDAAANEGNDVDLGHLSSKELLLTRSTHLIIHMADPESLSIFSGALRLLLDGALERVMTIGPIPPLQYLLTAAESDGTELALKKAIDSGRFAIVDEFDQQALVSFLAAD